MSESPGLLNMQVTNPASGELLVEIAEDTPASIAEKLVQAREAQRAWARTPLEERMGCIRRFRARVEERTPELARTLTTEMGKPITQSLNELRAVLDRLDFFLERVPAELEAEVVLRSKDGGLEERIAHEPLGVIANVSAWNYPYFVGTNVFIPALLSGNAVMYKPSELSTLSGLEIARALRESGVPADAFSPVIGGGEVGSELVRQPVDAVFFTGSYATGQKIAAAVAPRLIKLQLELGGKDPVYVADDVDIDVAVTSLADGAFYNTGQSCCAVERIYVHSAIWQRFMDGFVSAVRSFRVGDPMDESTYIGPLARQKAQILHLSAQVDDARAAGASVLLGGERLNRPGYFFAPTVLTEVTHSMRVMTEETFGPVIGIMKVDSDEEALRLMNDTEYGLTAAVYSTDRGRAEAILRELSVGTAYWNCCDRVSPRLPWSGRRHSGIGCTLSTYGIEAFLAPKAWHLKRPRS